MAFFRLYCPTSGKNREGIRLLWGKNKNLVGGLAFDVWI